MADVSVLHIVISLLAGVAGGFIGGVTGGAGLISIPALIFLGLSADAAIATNALTGFGIVASALPKYNKAKQVQWRTGFKLAPVALLGGFLGAKELVRINADTLTVVIGVLLLLMIPIILFSERGLKNFRVSEDRRVAGYVAYFLVMIYSGLLGAGGAVFAVYVLVYFFGMTYIQAKSTITVNTFFLCVAAVSVFLAHGLVNFKLGIPITIGMYIGAGAGATAALEKGNTWVRAVLVIVTLASSVKLLFFR